jgi:gliding motility-associated-like protein
LLKLKSVIFLFLLSLTSLTAQVTTEGKDFWFGFMHNDAASSIEVYISAKEAALVTIEAPLTGFVTQVSVAASSSVKVILPLSLMPITEGKQSLGIHVISTTDISLYTLNKRIFSADAAVILPTPILGQEYFVIAHKEPPGDGTGNDRESELLVVATVDNTKVEVTPSVATFSGWPAGETRTIELNAGETYQIKSNEDLTGSYILDVSESDPNGSVCSRIAVYGGNRFTNVGGCGGNHDHLIEQMFPVPTWGKNFLFVPYETRFGGDYLKVIASENNTKVEITNMGPRTLNRGEVLVIKALDGVRSIVADKPVQIAQFSRSTQCDGADGDPFMIMLSPLEQRVDEVTFSTFEVDQIDQYYLTLITGADDTDEILLDGVNIGGQFTRFGEGAYLSLEVSKGTHNITAENGVIAYVYGYGPSESFGYSAGVSLEVLNVEIQPLDAQIGIFTLEGCINSEITFDALFDIPVGEQPRYDTFDWDFGDRVLVSGKVVTHTFTEPGTYEIILLASKGSAACGSSETIRKTIVITDIAFDEILGPISVCPDVTEIEYSVAGSSENSYEWFVEGGTINGSNTAQNILIDWGVSRDDASVKLLVKNSIGCAADTVQLDVRINKRLEPIAPRGDEEVCFLDLATVPYSTPPTNGSFYEWYVEGGDFVGGLNTGTDIAVAWNGAGAGKLWYTEENPLIPECKGTSDTTFVTIYTEILPVETITDVLCNAEANGTIDLTVSGGKGTYNVVWSNGATEFNIEGLLAGTYTATITDELGCEISRDYQVGEPEVLEVNSHVILDVRCFQEANGEISLDVIGGTVPYSYHFTGIGMDIVTSTPSVGGMVTGDYSVEITDANGCSTIFPFFIDEPALLEPDLETLINLPICPQASDGTVFIDAKGGTPVYQFFWDTVPVQEGSEATGLSRGIYNVRIVDANGCEATLAVEVNERFPRVYIPSAFNPNSAEEKNQLFKAVTDCNLEYSMQVFNKWGSIIFATTDISEGWDGTYKGTDVPDGAYSYKVFYTGSINEMPFAETVRGTVRVFR